MTAEEKLLGKLRESTHYKQALQLITTYGLQKKNEVLDRAAEVARCKRYDYDESGNEINVVYTDNYFDSHDTHNYGVDKQSILNLKNKL